MKTKLMLALGSIAISAAILEGILHCFYSPESGKYRLSPFPKSSGFVIVNPNIKFDSIRGYRFLQDIESRYCYFFENSREIDFRMHVNNRGYASKLDYNFKKQPGTKRYLVFGDSFSAGVLMDTTWVDWINIFFKENNVATELYNFSVDGGGMSNWWSIYRHEIACCYEFDGVILSPYIDNLNRYFVAWWTDSTCVKGGYFPNASDFTNRDALGMCAFQVHSEKEFENFEEHYFERDNTRQKPALMIPALLSKELQWGDPYERGQRKYYSRFIDDGDPLPFEKLGGRYNTRNLQLLDSLAADLKAHGRELLIAAIPDRYVVGKKKKDTSFKALYENDLEQISEHYASPLFNGNTAFLEYFSAEINDMWLKGDLHWNSKGAKAFAQKYYPVLSTVTAD